MNENDMRARIGTLLGLLKASPRAPVTSVEGQIQTAMIIGAELLGELLIDIKRASNALDKRIE